MTAPLDQLLFLLDEGFDGKAWHGPTLGGALRGVNVGLAAWRPAPSMHNIWELTVHAAYWKYAVRRRLAGEKRGRFAVKGSNWFLRPPGGTPVTARDALWREDVRLLRDEHERLRGVIAAMRPADLDRRLPGTTFTFGYLVRGIAAHDLYHAGQVRLLKRLHGARR